MAPERELPESEVAKNCFSLLRWGIEQISDPEYQARVWLGDPPDEKSSYLDASAEILDQEQRNKLIGDHLAEIGLNEQQWARVMQFARTLEAFENSVDHPYDSAEVIRHPNWGSIVSQARAVLADLPNPD